MCGIARAARVVVENWCYTLTPYVNDARTTHLHTLTFSTFWLLLIAWSNYSRVHVCVCVYLYIYQLRSYILISMLLL
jgi:hypothetical protein